MSMMIELFKHFQLRFGISDIFSVKACLLKWRALLVQMEQMLFILRIRIFTSDYMKHHVFELGKRYEDMTDHRSFYVHILSSCEIKV